MTLLGIDDIRKPFDGWAERYAPFHPDEIIWTMNYDEVMTFLEKRGCPDEVCFDHDLGETGENERNRLTCAKTIIDYCMKNNLTYLHTTHSSQIL